MNLLANWMNSVRSLSSKTRVTGTLLFRICKILHIHRERKKKITSIQNRWLVQHQIISPSDQNPITVWIDRLDLFT